MNIEQQQKKKKKRKIKTTTNKSGDYTHRHNAQVNKMTNNTNL